MAQEVTVAKFDDKEVRDFISNLKSRLKNVTDGETKYIGLLSAIVYADVLDHFRGQQGSKGPWAKWSKSYQEQMNREGKGNNKILQDTGKLRQNFIPSNVKKTGKGFLWFNNATTEKGFPYAWGHDTGNVKGKKIRDFMWLSDKALDKISEQTLAFMLDEGI